MLVLQLLADLTGYWIVRILLGLMPRLRIVVQPLASPLIRYNALGYRRDAEGRIEIEASTAGFIGFFIGLFGCVAIAFLIHVAARSIS